MTEARLFAAALGLYALCTVGVWAAAIFRGERATRAFVWGAGLGFILHGAALAWRWRTVGHGPYLTGTEVFSSTAWVLLAAYLLLQLRYPSLRPIAVFVLPLVLLGQAIAAGYDPGAVTAPPTFDSAWLIVHIGSAKLSYASLGLAAALSAAYLWKARRAEGAWSARLPALPELDLIAYRLSFLGFLCLGLAVGAGACWANLAWGRYWGWDAIEIWALLTFLVYGIYLHLRRTRAWSGRRAAWYTLCAFGLVLILLTGLSPLARSIHAFYRAG